MNVSRFTFNMFGVNTYILWDDISKEAAIIDPGMINDAERKSIDEFIELKGLHLKCLINTHMHNDHSFGVAYIKDKYGLNLMGNIDDQFLAERLKQQANMFGLSISIADLAIEVDLKDGDKLKIGDEDIIIKPNEIKLIKTGLAFELPEGYGHLTLSFDDIAVWDNTYHDVNYYEKTKAIVDKAFKDAAGPSLSEFVGEVGQRLRNLTAIYESTRGFSGAYGWTNIHTFKIGEDVLVWFTAKDLDLELGATVDLTGTIKKHEEFRGVKTTQLSRCIIKEVA